MRRDRQRPSATASHRASLYSRTFLPRLHLSPIVDSSGWGLKCVIATIRWSTLLSRRRWLMNCGLRIGWQQKWFSWTGYRAPGAKSNKWQKYCNLNVIDVWMKAKGHWPSVGLRGATDPSSIDFYLAGWRLVVDGGGVWSPLAACTI